MPKLEDGTPGFSKKKKKKKNFGAQVCGAGRHLKIYKVLDPRVCSKKKKKELGAQVCENCTRCWASCKKKKKLGCPGL